MNRNSLLLTGIMIIIFVIISLTGCKSDQHWINDHDNDEGNLTENYVEDFEDNDISDWKFVDGSYTVTIDGFMGANGSSNSLKLTGGGKDGKRKDGIYKELPNIKPAYLRFFVRKPEGSFMGANFWIGNSLGGCLTEFRIAYQNLQVDEIGIKNGTINTWYKVEFKNIDWTSRVFDVYVDGKLVLSDKSFYSSSLTYINELHLYNHHRTSVWFDEISIRMYR